MLDILPSNPRVLEPIIFPLCLRIRTTSRRASIQHHVCHHILGSDGTIVITIFPSSPASYFSGLSHGLWPRKRWNQRDRVPTIDHYIHDGLRCLIRSNDCSFLTKYTSIAPALPMPLLSLTISRLLSSSILSCNWSLVPFVVLQSRTHPWRSSGGHGSTNSTHLPEH